MSDGSRIRTIHVVANTHWDREFRESFERTRRRLAARGVAASPGARPMRAGYTPCNWGQPGQLPQIFRGFGIDTALFYRGIGPHESDAEFLWRAPDGSEVVAPRP